MPYREEHGPIIGTAQAITPDHVEVDIGQIGRKRLGWRGKGCYWFAVRRVAAAQEEISL